jgi:8-oxo-dGTP diphosphatase
MNSLDEKMSDWKRYSVAQGVLIHQERVLLVGNDYGLKQLVWSLPGGRLEPGEQHTSALIREFREETGLEIVPDNLLYVVDARTMVEQRQFITCVFAVHLAVESEIEPEVSCATDERVQQVRFVPFAEAAQNRLLPSLGEPLLNYLYHGERLPQRYWCYPEYLRQDWQPLSWPPSTVIQAE